MTVRWMHSEPMAEYDNHFASVTQGVGDDGSSWMYTWRSESEDDSDWSIVLQLRRVTFDGPALDAVWTFDDGTHETSEDAFEAADKLQIEILADPETMLAEQEGR